MSASTVRLREISDLIENLIIRPSSDSVVRVQHLAEIQHALRKECDRIDAMEPDSEAPAPDAVPSLSLGQLWHDVYLAGVSNGVSHTLADEAADRAVNMATMPGWGVAWSPKGT